MAARAQQLLVNASEGRPRALVRLVAHALAMIASWYVCAVLVVSAGGSGEGGLRVGSMLIMGFAATSSTWLCATQLDRRRFVELGLVLSRRWWADFGAGVGIGVVLMGGIFALELGAGWVEVVGTFVLGAGAGAGESSTGAGAGSFAWALLGPAITFALVAFYEELVSRGYHLRNLAEGLAGLGPLAERRAWGLALAVLGSSLVFGLLHASNANATAASTFNVALAGCMLAASVAWTGQLGLAIGLHLSWNFCQGNVFGFPVSGGDAGPRLIALEQGGDAWITGGDFGPEAGLIGVAAMLAGVGLQALWVRLTRGELTLDAGLLRARGADAPATPPARG